MNIASGMSGGITLDALTTVAVQAIQNLPEIRGTVQSTHASTTAGQAARLEYSLALAVGATTLVEKTWQWIYVTASRVYVVSTGAPETDLEAEAVFEKIVQSFRLIA